MRGKKAGMIGIDDVVVEMNGMKFRTIESLAGGAIPANTLVTVANWNGTSTNATIHAIPGLKGASTLVPKFALEPEYVQRGTIRRYDVGLPSQRQTVKNAHAQMDAHKTKIAAHQAKKSEFIKFKNLKGWEAQRKVLDDELTRQQAELEKREKTLSRMLVRQAMYNRFDQVILDSIVHYTTKLSPAKPLDPNIIKSMAFEEGRMGTAGEHFTLPPYNWMDVDHHYLKTRFNIMQAVDSAEEQQLLMIEEMANAEIFLVYDLPKLKKEHKSKGLSRDQFYTWNGGKFVLAMDAFFKYRNKKGYSFMGRALDLYADYGFWVRTGTRWLFYKYGVVGKDWNEAVRAYNGDGPKARAYRGRVMARVGANTPLHVGND